MNQKEYEEMRKLITAQKEQLKQLEQSNNEMYGAIIQLHKQLKAKNTFIIEKHLTSQYAKWLVEYNKSNTT